MKPLLRHLAPLVVVLSLGITGLAKAQSAPSCLAGSARTCSISSAASAGTGNGLPFTDADLTLLVLGGGTMILMGLVVRRLIVLSDRRHRKSAVAQRDLRPTQIPSTR